MTLSQLVISFQICYLHHPLKKPVINVRKNINTFRYRSEQHATRICIPIRWTVKKQGWWKMARMMTDRLIPIAYRYASISDMLGSEVKYRINFPSNRGCTTFVTSCKKKKEIKNTANISLTRHCIQIFSNLFIMYFYKYIQKY